MLHLYIGDGKGKTTAALGLALRASGWGKTAYVAQFMKDKDFPCGEMNAARKYFKVLAIERFPGQIHPFFVKEEQLDRTRIKESVRQAIAKIEEYLELRKFDLIILDEILNAHAEHFCNVKDLARLIRKAGSQELVMTGRRAPASIIRKSDYVSIIKKCKHPYDRKQAARKGIEY